MGNSIIDKDTFQIRSDRLAKQSDLVSSAIDLAFIAGDNGKHFDIVTESDDYDVEKDYITPCHDFDEGFTFDAVVGGASLFSKQINTDVTHVVRMGETNMDSYLSGLDFNVSPEYEKLYHSVRGSHLDAIDVFGAPVSLGAYEIEALDVGVFTDGDAIGTGTGKCSDTNHAQAIFRATVDGVTIGVSDLVLTLTMKGESGNQFTEEITVPAGSLSGAYVDTIESGIDLVNAVHSSGTEGDKVKIVSKLERVIVL